MMTQRDPYVNMLRVTIAAFAAGLGGANAITVLPFTRRSDCPTRFARRVARNTQLILLEESNLAKVADPAAGSGGIEDLTDQLCRAAWTLFQEIEKEGGAAQAAATGWLINAVVKVATARAKAIATRKDPLTGTSEFPHLAELPVTVLKPAPATVSAIHDVATSRMLYPKRLAEPFEDLRDAIRRLASQDRPAAARLSGDAWPADGLHRACDLCEKFLRSWRHRGGRVRGGRSRDALQDVRCRIRLPVFV